MTDDDQAAAVEVFMKFDFAGHGLHGLAADCARPEAQQGIEALAAAVAAAVRNLPHLHPYYYVQSGTKPQHAAESASSTEDAA